MVQYLVNFFGKTTLVSACILFSRVTGFVREIAMASWLGTSYITDAIIIVSRLPALVRKITTDGPVNAVLIPLIDSVHTKRNVVGHLIRGIIIWITAVLIIICLLTIFYKDSIAAIFSPGLANSPLTLQWFKYLLPFAMFCIVFYFLGGVFGAVLNYHQSFFWPAMASVFFNCTMIIGFIVANYFSLSYYIIGPIVLLAGMAQGITPLFSYLKLKLPFKRDKTGEGDAVLKQFFITFLPIIFSACVWQINSTILIMIASFLPTGNMTLLYRADRLLQLPIAIIISLNTVLLPTLSSQHELSKQKKLFKLSMLFVACIALPIAILFYFFNKPLVSIVFFYGKCGMADITAISAMLKLYAFGIPTFLLIRVLPIFFFAKRKIKITTIGATMQTICNLSLAIFLMPKYGANGLIYSSIISSTLNSVFLLISLTYILYRAKE